MRICEPPPLILVVVHQLALVHRVVRVLVARRRRVVGGGAARHALLDGQVLATPHVAEAVLLVPVHVAAALGIQHLDDEDLLRAHVLHVHGVVRVLVGHEVRRGLLGCARPSAGDGHE
jgi:hypothetical protein